MNRKKVAYVIIAVFSVVVIITIFALAQGQVPHLINFQGRLSNQDGNSLTGPHNITFRIDDGDTALDLPFDDNYWIGIEVDSDGEMNPRRKLVSVAYAYRADYAWNADYSSDSDMVDGQHYSDMQSDINTAVGNHDVNASAHSSITIANSDKVDGKHYSDIVSDINSAVATHESDLTSHPDCPSGMIDMGYYCIDQGLANGGSPLKGSNADSYCINDSPSKRLCDYSEIKHACNGGYITVSSPREWTASFGLYADSQFILFLITDSNCGWYMEDYDNETINRLFSSCSQA